MKKLNIEIKYLYNSGWTLETENHFLVFDYYKGDLNIPDKNTTFFISHGHEDHYNRDVFDHLLTANYIISDDIQGLFERDNIKIVKAGDEFYFNDLRVLVLDSTDLGVAFLIKVDGLTIFHAGDLNWWAWDDSTAEKELDRERKYKKEIDKMVCAEIDVAFVPVDPRLKENYYLAGEYFIKTLKPKYFFPMHFRDNYEFNKKFIDKMKSFKTHIFDITERNQVFKL